MGSTLLHPLCGKEVHKEREGKPRLAIRSSTEQLPILALEGTQELGIMGALYDVRGWAVDLVLDKKLLDDRI